MFGSYYYAINILNTVVKTDAYNSIKKKDWYFRLTYLKKGNKLQAFKLFK